jgi:hypothetical protein
VHLSELANWTRVEELSTQERVEGVDQNQKKLGSKRRACKVISIAESTCYADPKISRTEQEE